MLAAVWRILVGISLIPAFGTLYQRLTLPESTRYVEQRKRAAEDVEASTDDLKKPVSEKTEPAPSSNSSDGTPAASAVDDGAHAKDIARAKKAHFREFFVYFSEWRHLRILIGTCMCWFLLDIAYVFNILILAKRRG